MGSKCHPVELGLHAKNDREQIGKIMCQTAGQLSGHFTAPRLLQGRSRLGFFGHVLRQDVDPRFQWIRGEDDANAPGRCLVGEFKCALLPVLCGLEIGLNLGEGLGP